MFAINWCQNQSSLKLGTGSANHQGLFKNFFGLLFSFKTRKINVARYITVYGRTSFFMFIQFYCLFLSRQPYQVEQPNLWVSLRRKKGLTISDLLLDLGYSLTLMNLSCKGQIFFLQPQTCKGFITNFIPCFHSSVLYMSVSYSFSFQIINVIKFDYSRMIRKQFMLIFLQLQT